MKCKNCGAEVGIEYRLCPYCRAEIEYPKTSQDTAQQPIIIQNIVNNTNTAPVNSVPFAAQYEQHSKKSKTVALILSIALGYVGGHCFYAGKIGKGILYLLTCGLFCFGWIYDIIKIASGTYKDGNGLPIDKN